MDARGQGAQAERAKLREFVGGVTQRATLAEARRKLFEARDKRVHPGRDEKVLASWNGLMLAAIPLLQDRGLANGQAAAYVCRDFSCQAPVTEPEALQAQLEQR